MSGSNWRKSDTIIALIIATFIAIPLVWGLAQQKHKKQATQINQSTQEYDNTYRGPSEGYWWPEFAARDTYAQWAMTFFAFIATIASIVAVILLYSTLKTTRKLNKLTSEAFLNEQRPWLKVTPNNFIEIGRTEDNWFSVYGVNIENVGKSPAVNITFLTKTFFIDGQNNPNDEISIFREDLLKKARRERAINFGVMYPPDEPKPISVDNNVILESRKDRVSGYVIYGIAYMQPGIEKDFLVMDGCAFISPYNKPDMIGFNPNMIGIGEKVSFSVSIPTIYKYLESHDRKIST